MASSSRGRSSSPFPYCKSSTPYSSSSSSIMNCRILPRSYSSSMMSFYGSRNSSNSRSMTPSHSHSDSAYSQGYENHTLVSYLSEAELIDVPADVSRSGDGIFVMISTNE